MPQRISPDDEAPDLKQEKRGERYADNSQDR